MSQLFKISILLVLVLIIGLWPTSVLAGYTGYSYRASLTIPYTWFGTDLANFPVLITASSVPAALFDYANADGGDIRFSTDTAGDVPLNREIVAYNNTADTMEAWVKVPSVSSTTNTVIYIWYGNAGASEPAANDADEGSQGVWDANYKGVYHLQEAVNIGYRGYLDSTANLNHLTGVSMAMDAQPGKWGGLAAEFDGTADYLIATTSLPVTTLPFTMTTWFNPDDDTGVYGILGASDPTVTVAYYGLYAIGSATNDPLRATHVNGGTAQTEKTGYDASTWYHGAGVFTSTNNRNVALNGSFGTAATGFITAVPSPNFTISGRVRSDGLSIPFNGKIDEVRVSDVARADAWVTAEYNSGNVPGDIVDGTPEDLGGGGGSVTRAIRLTGGVRLLGGVRLQ